METYEYLPEVPAPGGLQPRTDYTERIPEDAMEVAVVSSPPISADPVTVSPTRFVPRATDATDTQLFLLNGGTCRAERVKRVHERIVDDIVILLSARRENEYLLGKRLWQLQRVHLYGRSGSAGFVATLGDFEPKISRAAAYRAIQWYREVQHEKTALRAEFVSREEKEAMAAEIEDLSGECWEESRAEADIRAKATERALESRKQAREHKRTEMRERGIGLPLHLSLVDLPKKKRNEVLDLWRRLHKKYGDARGSALVADAILMLKSKVQTEDPS
jgi:hypothetical protein